MQTDKSGDAMNKQALPLGQTATGTAQIESAEYVGNITVRAPEVAPRAGKSGSRPLTQKAMLDSGTVMQAAKGDDDLMSQEPARIVDADGGAKIWKRNIGRAKKTWSELARADLAKVDGNPAKLADLLRRHYSLGEAEVERQIADFFSSKAYGVIS